MAKRTFFNVTAERDLRKVVVAITSVIAILTIILVVRGSRANDYKFVMYSDEDPFIYEEPAEADTLTPEELRVLGRSYTNYDQRYYVVDDNILSPEGRRLYKIRTISGKTGYVLPSVLSDIPNVPRISEETAETNPNYSYCCNGVYHWDKKDFPELAKGKSE